MNKATICSMLACLALLSGCDINEEVSKMVKEVPAPYIILGAGIELDIGDGQTAKVYGPDMCETGFEDDYHSVDLMTGCTLLSGKESVEVTLVVGGQRSFKETWDVNEGIGPSGKGVGVTRPNGWVVRESTE